MQQNLLLRCQKGLHSSAKTNMRKTQLLTPIACLPLSPHLLGKDEAHMAVCRVQQTRHREVASIQRRYQHHKACVRVRGIVPSGMLTQAEQLQAAKRNDRAASKSSEEEEQTIVPAGCC
jgi:hypothetical protein